MKTLSLMLVAVMLVASVPVFACGGDKDKESAPDVMCGGSGCDKDKEPAPAPDVMCGGDKDEETAPDVMCGGDKDKEPAPDVMCGGSCGSDKDEPAPDTEA